MRRRGWTALFVLGGALAGPSAASQQDVASLQPGVEIDRPIARGETHEFRLTLAAGDCITVVVDQHGVDVAVQVRDTRSAVIADADDDVTKGGSEQLDLVAAVSGVYTLVVSPSPGNVAPGTFGIRAINRHAASGADQMLQQARTLRSEASKQSEGGTLDAARQSLERALALAESAIGADAPFVIALEGDLGANALEARDNTRAETFYLRALTATSRNAQPGDPREAIIQSRLAIVYDRAGDRLKAETTLRQAIGAIEQRLGRAHLWYVRALITLSNLRNEAGDLKTAEEIDRQGIATLETVHETDGLMYAGLLNNLGDLYRQAGDNARANEYLLSALAMGERLRGPDSFYVSTTLQNLGIVARELQQFEAAEAYELRAIAIRERLEGPNHPDVAQALINLGNIYRAQGDVQKSLDTQFRALHIWEATGGPYERGTLLTLGNIARTYASIDDVPHAIEYQRRTDALLETHLALNLSMGSERERLAYFRSMAERTDRTVSLHLNMAPGAPDAASLATLVLLQRKGRVLDAMANTLAAVRRGADAHDRALLDQLRETTSDLSQAAFSPVTNEKRAERQRLIAALDARKETLERDLGAHSDAFRAETQPVTIEAVQSAIPDDAALIEFAVFRPFNPKANSNADAYAAPHYAAYVLRRHQAPVGVDLGPAAAVDDAIAAFRRSLADPRCSDVKTHAAALGRQVVLPIASAIGDATRLLISPDGDLNLIPFDALVAGDERYLIERYAITYLTSGRDLLRLRVSRISQSAPIILANPLFGEPTVAPRGPGGETRGPLTSDGTSAAMYFAPLPSAAVEARAIKALFPQATLLSGREATKTSLLAVAGPEILHIASHGFFLQDKTLDNPLLRSGIALAGANLGRSSGDDGLLTALEASGLNLWGTKLVTLSACDTGVGEIHNGEGVYGLRRAFVLAGTETLVMSLWPVSDRITRETMTTYYTGLRDGLGRGDALRQAKLALLARANWSHPYYWASFIQSGEWASLNGRG